MKKNTNSFDHKPPFKVENASSEMAVLFRAQKEEMRLDMEVTLARIIALLKIIHNENMTMYRMFLGGRADEIISKYDEQFKEILKTDIDTEK